MKKKASNVKRTPAVAVKRVVRHPGTIIVCGKVLNLINLNALRRQMAEDFKDRYGIGDGEDA